MLKNRVTYFILLLLSLVLFIFTNAYATLLIFALLLLLPIVSLCLMLHSSNRIDISADVPETVFKGDGLTIHVGFKNSDFLPVARLKFTLSLTNILVGETVKSSFYCFVPGKSTQDCHMSIEEIHVGKIFISTEDLKVYDILGLFSKKVSGFEECTVLVYPKYQPINVGTEFSHEIYGDSDKYSEHKAGSDVNEIYDIKEYTPDCEMRKIDWKLSGKLDKLIVREYGFPLNYSIYILTELFLASNSVSSEQCVQFASDLSLSLLEQGFFHNIAWFDKERGSLSVFPVSSHEEYEIALFNMVSSIGYDDGLKSLEMFSENPVVGDTSTVVYVTPKTDEEKVAALSLDRTFRTVLIKGSRHYTDFGSIL